MTSLRAFGRFELLERLWQSPLIEVYRGLDIQRDEGVHVWRIDLGAAPATSIVTGGLLSALEDATQRASSTGDDRLARVVEQGPEGQSYFVVYAAHGPTWFDVFVRAIQEKDPPPMGVLVRAFSDTAAALEAAHRAALRHGSVRLENLTFTPDGRALLAGLGLATALETALQATPASLGYWLGCMSPEVATGATADNRDDIFGVGACMWEMLTLQRLFRDADLSPNADRVQNAAVFDPSHFNAAVPPSLEKIVRKSLAKLPAERYGAATDLHEELVALSDEMKNESSRDVTRDYLSQAFSNSATGKEPDALDLLASADKAASKKAVTDVMVEKSDKNGSDLDIFEGLVKKGKEPAQAAAPPPPPPSSQLGATRSDTVTNPLSVTPPTIPAAFGVQKKTLVGVPPSPLPPPPASDAATAPTVQALDATTTKVVPNPVATKPASRGIEMEWTDDDEATHVFDKESSVVKPNPASSPTLVGAPSSKAPSVPIVPPPSAPPRASHPSLRPSSAPGLQSAAGLAGPPSGRPTLASSAPPPVPPPSSATSAASVPAPPPSVGSLFSKAGTSAAPIPPPPRSSMSPPLPPGAPPPPPGAMGAVGMMPTPGAPPAPPAPPPSAEGKTVPMAMPGVPPPAIGMSAAPVAMPNSMEATAMVRPQSSGPSKAVLAGAGALVAIVGVIGVMFAMPKNGQLTINVADHTGTAVDSLKVFVDGRHQCDTVPCVVRDLPPGSYKVKVQANGMEELRDVTLDARQQASLDIRMSQGTGLKVTGSQPGVRLVIDDREIGPLPQTVRDLKAGEHKVRLTGGERYQPLDRTINISKDEVVDLGDQKLKVAKGKVTITLNTAGAKVYLVSDKTRLEPPTLPASIDDLDPAKSWSLEATKTGFIDYKQPIAFDDGVAEKTFVITMDPKGGAPTAAVAPAAPRSDKPAEAPTHHAAAKQTPAPEKEKPAAEKPAEKAAATGEAFLNINSIPVSAVILDGKPIGTTPKIKVPVTPGQHSVLFVNTDQNLKKQISVSVGSGETKPAFAKLKE